MITIMITGGWACRVVGRRGFAAMMDHVSAILSRPLLRRDEPRLGSFVPWLAGVVAGGWALVAGAALAVLPALVLWIGDGASDPVRAPAEAGAVIWLAAHRAPLTMVDGGTLQLAPGGLSLLIVLLLYRAGRWAAHVTAADEPRTVAHILAPAVAGYALAGTVAARSAVTADLSVSPPWAAMWCGGVILVAMGAGVAREARGATGLSARLPAPLKTSLLGAAGIVLALLVVGAVVTALSIGMHSGEIGDGVSALRADRPGLIVLAALNLTLVINAIVWGAAYSLGPGFHLGADSIVSPAVIDVGPLPVMPLLGAVPSQPGGTLGWLVLAGPVGAGLIGGALVGRRGSASPRLLVAAMGLGAGAIAAVMMAVLALLSGGSAGADRLAQIGPVPWQVALATLVLGGIPAAAAAGLMNGLPASFWPDIRTADEESDDADAEADRDQPEPADVS